MFCKLIVVVLVSLIGAALGESSLIYMWNHHSIDKPAFNTIFQDEFAKIVEPILKDNMLLVFQEPALIPYDLTCKKASSGKSCQNYLANVAPKNYYPNVVNSIEAVKEKSSQLEHVGIDVNGNLESNVACEPGKSVFIKFNDENAIARHELLEKHDKIISDVVSIISEKCKITAIYTRSPSTTDEKRNRRRRAVADKATSGTKFQSGKDFLIFYTDLDVRELVNGKEQITPISISEMNLSGQNATYFIVNLSGGQNKLNFAISLSHGYYKMSGLTLNDEAFYVSSDVNAPTDFSYTCGNQTFSAKNSTKTIIWNSFQMQAPFNDATPNNFKFGDAWYCVGFFSSGILAGLFVVFILLGIMSVGICWMLDINTMDRFDDPKGKTITINVNE